MTVEKEQNDQINGEWGFLNKLRKNIEGNNEEEINRRSVLRNSADNQRSLERVVLYTQAKTKLTQFMSEDTGDEQEHDENLLDGYHFETVSRWINIKPQPEMVVREVRALSSNFQEIIDSYLKSNPARIKELQVQLNDWINYWMVIDDERSPSGRRTINPIDRDILMEILQCTGMELIDNWEGSKRRYTIREDWLLWPQTFAAICCFKKEYRRISTRNTNRRPQQRH